MALTKVPYVDNETKISADNMNAIQDEIIKNASDVDEALNRSYMWYFGAGAPYPRLDTVAKTLTIPYSPTDSGIFINHTLNRLTNGATTIDLSAGFALSTSLFAVICKVSTNEISCVAYSAIPKTDCVIIALIRKGAVASSGIKYPTTMSMTCPFYVDDKLYGVLDVNSIQADSHVKSINHRGYNSVAPENTLSAFRLSAQKGFKYVECDVRASMDGVPVLLHDETVDRTSNSNGYVDDMSLSTLKTIDFGSWKNEAYAGEQIPTFDEFVALCRNLGLHPYIELKVCTDDFVATLVAILKKYGMLRNCTWLGTRDQQSIVRAADPKARYGWVCGDPSASSVDILIAGKGEGEVFVDVNANTLTADHVNMLIEKGVPLEVYGINNTENAVLALNPYITGVTSDIVNAGKILRDNSL